MPASYVRIPGQTLSRRDLELDPELSRNRKRLSTYEELAILWVEGFEIRDENEKTLNKEFAIDQWRRWVLIGITKLYDEQKCRSKTKAVSRILRADPKMFSIDRWIAYEQQN